MASYIYVLRGANGKYYVGQTTNVPRRVERHKTHIAQQITRRSITTLTLPLTIVFVSEASHCRWGYIETELRHRLRQGMNPDYIPGFFRSLESYRRFLESLSALASPDASVHDTLDTG